MYHLIDSRQSNFSDTTANLCIVIATNINTSPNKHYRSIAKNFFEKYVNVTDNIRATYYDTNAFISIHIHDSNQAGILYESVGYDNFISRLTELKVHGLKYCSSTFTAQPISTDMVIATFNGKVDINGINYGVVSTFVVKHHETGAKITNHMMDINV